MQSIAFSTDFSRPTDLANSWRNLILCLAPLFFVQCSSLTAFSQEDTFPEKNPASLAALQIHLSAGEFSVAEKLIERLPDDQTEQGRVLLFQAQAISGAGKGALLTVGKIENDPLRSTQMNWLRRQITGETSDSAQSYNGKCDASGAQEIQSPPRQQPQGVSGGITEADFTSLIELITNTIAPSTWSDAGGPASIRSFPSGVYVDSSGTLQRIRMESLKDRNKRETANLAPKDAADWFQDSGNRQVQHLSRLRKVSLTRLERVAQTRFSMGVPFDESILNLAGLTSVDYVFFDPQRGEIIIAGPAGGWENDQLGRPCNIQNRKPVMQLDDFVVCHRNARHDGGKFGCSIDPRAANLKAAQELIQKGIRNQTQWRENLRDALGKQDITVFGIDPRTHAGRVLVDADHHMKLVGMGLAPTIPQVPSYFDRLGMNQEEATAANEVIRWWFTIRDGDLICDEAKEFFDITLVGVKVLSESEMLGDQGERIHTGQSTAPTQGFARDFTENFATMAAKYPVYEELKNIFRLAIVANLIKSQQFESRCGSSLDFFDSSKATDRLVYPTLLSPSPTQVDSVLNQKVLRERKAQSTIQKTIMGVSGGVEVDGVAAVSENRIKTSSEMSDLKKREMDRELSTIWWWD